MIGHIGRAKLRRFYHLISRLLMSLMTIRPHIFWALSILGIPAVYTLTAYFYERFEIKHPGFYLPTTGLRAVIWVCIGIGVVALQKQIPADTGDFTRVALTLAYAGAIFVLSMVVTFIVLFSVFGFGPGQPTF
jgi:hypothetical protein